MTLGDIIQSYRKQHKMSMDVFAEKSGISKAYISLLEKNQHPKTGKAISPSIQSIKQAALGMDMDFDLLLNIINDSVASPKTPTHSTTIPVLDGTIKKISFHSSKTGIATEELTEEMASTGNFFGLKVYGDSMEPKISNGDVVIVRQQSDAESGDIVIALVNGQDTTCRRLKKYAEGIMLLSNNPKYEPLVFSKQDITNNSVEIIGRVMELRAKF